MRKIIFGLIIVVPMLLSCEEDEYKVIQTDLPKEAAELFNISKGWNESLFFALMSWEQYQQIDSVGLPSCPDILLDQTSKKVTLNFLSSTACIQTGSYARGGKLIIQFDTTAESSSQKWTMEYEDYNFESNAIEGIRTFTSNDKINVLEEFSEMTERTANELSTIFSGTFIHKKAFSQNAFSSFTSSGEIIGINAAGREFEIKIATPLFRSIACYQQNEILPSAGKSNWLVSRGGNSKVTYIATYEPLPETCKVVVNAILPDGKKLLLNQSN
ncbi:hypothetical protein LV84_01297 [Algoriphagus ratkowskyi]|uniref:Uncharacterized protein n=1 Tax=Algoriphagus ratkowskyi TaxID=57028 RepID=A0A2W7RVN1_9BACT|nr:hypothetical protein [Algoriphagus ratkowskyi]PZX59267.1 hypothetical protein LV84_01297 [Algoriphagus ratkowskyi]TXD77458.1 hypothetical protein ESW18_11695 [Algoriphagus ratkowskyi]